MSARDQLRSLLRRLSRDWSADGRAARGEAAARELLVEAQRSAITPRIIVAGVDPADEGCRPGCKPGGACKWVGCHNAPEDIPAPVECRCRCHRSPSVQHMAPCCCPHGFKRDCPNCGDKR